MSLTVLYYCNQLLLTGYRKIMIMRFYVKMYGKQNFIYNYKCIKHVLISTLPDIAEILLKLVSKTYQSTNQMPPRGTSYKYF